MDGARVFNAAEYLKKPVRDVVAEVDTVAFWLSKALGAPVGSMIAGIRPGYEARSPLPQAPWRWDAAGGHPAAAGLIAIEEHPGKLAADHANARFLAEALAKYRRSQSIPPQSRRTS